VSSRNCVPGKASESVAVYRARESGRRGRNGRKSLRDRDIEGGSEGRRRRRVFTIVEGSLSEGQADEGGYG
jgi:hypothetical protein